MADGGMRGRAGPLIVALAAAIPAVLSGCGPGADDAGTGPSDSSVWIAGQLGSIPEGYTLDRVDEYSSDGRRLGYRAIDRGPYGDDSWQIQVTTRVPMGWTVDEMIATYEGMPDDEVGDIEAEVDGHRAVVIPATDDGREYGWEVIWEPVPGVQVHVTDTRHDTQIRQTATREGALALAEDVHPIDRAGWDGLLAESLAAAPYPVSGDGVQRPIASGEVDGRTWSLSVIESSATTPILEACFRLTFAGADTGRSCAPERVVLADTGFVILRLGKAEEAPVLEPGPGSSFGPIQPEVYAFDTDTTWHVGIAVLPDGACGVEYRSAFSSPIDTPTPLNLLPGDPGSVECATR
jgi:hypothetical protein